MDSVLIHKRYLGNCAFCGRPLDIGEEHHLLFGIDRKKADDDGLKVPICSNCHTQNEVSCRIHGNPMAEKLSKMLGQMAFEKEMALHGYDSEECRDIFQRRYKKSYL